MAVEVGVLLFGELAVRTLVVAGLRVGIRVIRSERCGVNRLTPWIASGMPVFLAMGGRHENHGANLVGFTPPEPWELRFTSPVKPLGCLLASFEGGLRHYHRFAILEAQERV